MFCYFQMSEDQLPAKPRSMPPGGRLAAETETTSLHKPHEAVNNPSGERSEENGRDGDYRNQETIAESRRGTGTHSDFGGRERSGRSPFHGAEEPESRGDQIKNEKCEGNSSLVEPQPSNINTTTSGDEAQPSSRLSVPVLSRAKSEPRCNTGGTTTLSKNRPRPRQFVSTNVNAGSSQGQGPPQRSQDSDGGAGAAAAVVALTAARSHPRVSARATQAASSSASSVNHGCSSGGGRGSAAAAASAAAEAAAQYSGRGGMGLAVGVVPSPMPPSLHPNHPNHPNHHHHHQHHQHHHQHHRGYPESYGTGHVGGGGVVLGVAIGGGPGVGGRCDPGSSGSGEYPIAIPGTSVRRYMHIQLLLALMSVPGLKVAAPATVSWTRLGYYPVDTIFGALPPGTHPVPPGTSAKAAAVAAEAAEAAAAAATAATAAGSHTGFPQASSKATAAPSHPRPTKRRRVTIKKPKGERHASGGGARDSGAGSVAQQHQQQPSLGMMNTGAMAMMPPSQHSPRTSAMLSGLPMSFPVTGSAENAPLMLGETGEMNYYTMSPSAYMGFGGAACASPHDTQHCPGFRGGGTSAVNGGGGGGSYGGSSADVGTSDPNRYIDFAAAMGSMGGGVGGVGQQPMTPKFFPELGSISSLTSPAFGIGSEEKLSPLQGIFGPMSPQSLSPRAHWASGLQAFPN